MLFRFDVFRSGVCKILLLKSISSIVYNRSINSFLHVFRDRKWWKLRICLFLVLKVWWVLGDQNENLLCRYRFIRASLMQTFFQVQHIIKNYYALLVFMCNLEYFRSQSLICCYSRVLYCLLFTAKNGCDAIKNKRHL